jgi:hypothetical protein
MHSLSAYIATEHLFDLLREAEAERLARVARAARLSTPSEPVRGGGVGRWLGRSAVRLSNALDAFAARVDPVMAPPEKASSDDRRSRPVTA